MGRRACTEPHFLYKGDLYCRLSWMYRAKLLNHQFLHVFRRLTEYFGDRRHLFVTQLTTLRTFTTIKTSYLKSNKCISIAVIKKIALRYVK